MHWIKCWIGWQHSAQYICSTGSSDSFWQRNRWQCFLLCELWRALVFGRSVQWNCIQRPLYSPNGGNIGINSFSPDGKLAILHTLNSAYATTSRNNTFLQIRNDSCFWCICTIEIKRKLHRTGNDSITQLTTVDTGSEH